MQTLARGGESVVVDLSETVFIDSAIIYTLIEADSNLASRGQGFALQVGAEPIVANLMKLSACTTSHTRTSRLDRSCSISVCRARDVPPT
jgi:anti-anti-sigma regulatory factor